MTNAQLIKLEAAANAYTPPSARVNLPPLIDWIPTITKGYTPPTHLARVAELFERAKREPVFAVVHAPPRHGKTDLVLHALVKMLLETPEKTGAFITYAQRLSNSKSVSAKRMAANAGLGRGQPYTTQEWRTPEHGGLIASAVSGGITGQGVDLMVIDDYFKNRADAESKVLREKIFEWFKAVPMTRLEPGGSCIVSATRWHPDDLQGRLIAEGWEYIRLPAIDAAGAALWPERYTVADLERRRSIVGEYTWQSLYQGDPQPRGGRLFPDIRYWDTLPGGVFGSGLVPVAGLDLAYTAKTSSDYAVCFTGLASADTLYITDGWRGQVDSPAFMGVLKTFDAIGRRQFGKPYTWRTWISGTERGTVDMFMREGLNIYATPATGDKFVRAQPVSAASKRGAVLWPRADYLAERGLPVDWLNDCLPEILGFTGVADANDDAVDTLSAIWDAALIAGGGAFDETLAW